MFEKPEPSPVQETPEVSIDEWAAAGVAAMLARVRSVCITEYEWIIDELRGA